MEKTPPLALRSERTDLDRVRREYQLLVQAAEDLKQIGGVHFPLLQKRREVTEKRMWSETELQEALNLAREIREHAEAVEQARRGLVQREELCAALRRWAPLDLPLAEADTEHIRVVLQTLPAKTNWEHLQKAVQEAAPESVLVEVSRSKERRYVVLLCHRSGVDRALTALAHAGGRSCIAGRILPSGPAGNRTGRREQEELRGVITRKTQQLRAFGPQRPVLELALDQVRTRLLLEEAAPWD